MSDRIFVSTSGAHDHDRAAGTTSGPAQGTAPAVVPGHAVPVQPGAASSGAPRPFSRAAAAVALSGPLLVLASELVAPRQPDGMSPAEATAWVVEHSGRVGASYLVGLLAAAAMGATFVLLGTQAQARGRRPGRAAAVLGALGAVGLASHMAIELFIRDLLLANPQAATAVDEAANSGLAAVASILPLIVGITVGLVLLAVSALRAGWVRGWVVGLAVLALVADFAPTSWNTVIFAALASVVVGAVTTGLRRALD